MFGYCARDHALLILISCCIGSCLPELGNLLAMRQGLENVHHYNFVFLAGGVCGVTVSLYALLR
jgi:hypothetical protein